MIGAAGGGAPCGGAPHYGMSIFKAALSVAAGALTAAAALNLPAPYGAFVAAAVSAVAYLTNHDALVAAFLGTGTGK